MCLCHFHICTSFECICTTVYSKDRTYFLCMYTNPTVGSCEASIAPGRPMKTPGHHVVLQVLMMISNLECYCCESSIKL